jgi:hypothetical protein
VRPGSPAPEAIEVLAAHRRRSVYRLVGAGPGGASVVAKQLHPDDPEIVIQVRILPLLEVTTLECYGFVEPEGGRPATLFLEDAGELRFSRLSSANRRLAGRWLAELHAAVSETPEAEALLPLLPDRSPTYYHALLDQARRVLATWESPDSTAQEALEHLLASLDKIELFWPEVEEVCALLPRTLVHGDFRAKNMRIRREPDGTRAFLVFDWEYAGFGSPLVDLDSAVIQGYLDEAVAAGANELRPETVGSFGALMNTISAVSWFVADDEDEWWDDVATIDEYREVIDDAFRRCGRLPFSGSGSEARLPDSKRTR